MLFLYEDEDIGRFSNLPWCTFNTRLNFRLKFIDIATGFPESIQDAKVLGHIYQKDNNNEILLEPQVCALSLMLRVKSSVKMASKAIYL